MRVKTYFRETGNESKNLFREAISKILKNICKIEKFFYKVPKAFRITLVEAHSYIIGYCYIANISSLYILLFM